MTEDKKQKRLSADEWQEVRTRWENDPREGYEWIIQELNLTITRQALHKRAQKEGWAKQVSLKSIVQQAHASADARFAEREHAKVDEKVDTATKATRAQSVDMRADILEVHRTEWGTHRAAFTLEAMLNPDTGLDTARIAKTAAEAIRIRQEGERKAWGLDAVEQDTGAGVSTIDQLDAMFEAAMQKSQAMRDAMDKDRVRHLRA